MYMDKRLNLRHKMNQGISPKLFMEGMEIRTMVNSKIPNTKELFWANYENFSWSTEEDKRFFTAFSGRSDLYCMILCTDWCPDVMWNVPVLLRVMEQSGIPTVVLPMDDHLETMDLFLTDGGRAQPIAVFMTKDGDVLGRWGARPGYIQAVMDEFKKNYLDKRHPQYQENLNRVYGEIGSLYHEGASYRDAIIRDLRELFTSLA